MALTPEFRRFVTETIKNQLLVTPEIIQGIVKTKQVWKFQNESDYLYGFTIGMIFGDVYRYYRDIHGNNPPNDEDRKEMKELIEEHAKDFRKIFYK